MAISLGLHQLNSQIVIQASAEECYNAWVNIHQIPIFMKRVQRIDVEFLVKNKSEATIISPDEIQTKIKRFQQSDLYSNELKRWLFKGPGGKLYEIKNTAIVEIPNYFYCTASTDPDDIYSESAIYFIDDETNQSTLLKWEITFWQFSSEGSWTQFASDLLEGEDSFMADCLQDFKRFVEGNRP